MFKMRLTTLGLYTFIAFGLLCFVLGLIYICQLCFQYIAASSNYKLLTSKDAAAAALLRYPPEPLKTAQCPRKRARGKAEGVQIVLNCVSNISFQSKPIV